MFGTVILKGKIMNKTPASTVAARAAGAVRQQNEQHIRRGQIARRRVQRLAKALYKTARDAPEYFQYYSKFGWPDGAST